METRRIDGSGARRTVSSPLLQGLPELGWERLEAAGSEAERSGQVWGRVDQEFELTEFHDWLHVGVGKRRRSQEWQGLGHPVCMMMPLTEISNTAGLWLRLHPAEFVLLGTLGWSHSMGRWLYGTQEVNLGRINSRLKLDITQGDFTTSSPLQNCRTQTLVQDKKKCSENISSDFGVEMHKK